MAFTQKIIDVQVGGISTIGLRVSCHVLAGGENSLQECDAVIYGLPLSEQNSVSTLGWKGQKPGADQVSVFAGDTAGGMSLVYQGTIWAAYSDYQGGPNVPLHIVAHAGTKEAAMVAPPTSINNKSADVAQMMQKLAGQMGLQFENGGVNAKIAYPYLPGALKDQAWQLAAAANIHVTIDRGTLAIWPTDGSGARPGEVVVSPRTGLVGYPSWAAEGIRLKMLFNPNLKLGGHVTVTGSSITPANGTWEIVRLEHSLQSFTPDGEWFSSVVAWQPKPGQGEPSVAQ